MRCKRDLKGVTSIRRFEQFLEISTDHQIARKLSSSTACGASYEYADQRQEEMRICAET